jgi:hypothetical protein
MVELRWAIPRDCPPVRTREIDHRTQDEVKRYDNLVAYCERMRARFWPEPASEGRWVPPGSATEAGPGAPTAAAASPSPTPVRFSVSAR